VTHWRDQQRDERGLPNYIWAEAGVRVPLSDMSLLPLPDRIPVYPNIVTDSLLYTVLVNYDASTSCNKFIN
jgi:hypothetical protein